MDSGASLHMVTQNELTYGENIPSENQKNPRSPGPPTVRHNRRTRTGNCSGRAEILASATEEGEDTVEEVFLSGPCSGCHVDNFWMWRERVGGRMTL